MTRVVISMADQILNRYGNQMAALGERDARKALSRALNHEGNKGRTQVKRALVRQTGIKYGQINRAVTTIPSTVSTLTYIIRGAGNETNIALFGARQGKRGVSAAPWNTRRVFRSTFMVGRFGGNVFKRTSRKRFPIKGVYGPNIGRELVKDEARALFETTVAQNIANRVGHEIGRLLPKG